jgi:hypothetical protein
MVALAIFLLKIYSGNQDTGSSCKTKKRVPV